jgi:hypothetical protein
MVVTRAVDEDVVPLPPPLLLLPVAANEKPVEGAGAGVVVVIVDGAFDTLEAVTPPKENADDGADAVAAAARAGFGVVVVVAFVAVDGAMDGAAPKVNPPAAGAGVGVVDGAGVAPNVNVDIVLLDFDDVRSLEEQLCVRRFWEFVTGFDWFRWRFGGNGCFHLFGLCLIVCFRGSPIVVIVVRNAMR